MSKFYKPSSSTNTFDRANSSSRFEKKDSSTNPRNSNTRFPYKSNKPELSGLVKKVSRLKNERGRLESSMFLIEGTSHILDVLEISPSIINEVFVSKEFEKDNSKELQRFEKYDVPLTFISKDEIKILSSLQTPPGIIAKAYFSNLKINWNTAKTITMLDGVQDPGNVGSIFRTALAMKHDAILLGKGTCEPYNPKVVRSSVSQFLRIPFEVNVSLVAKISFLRSKGFGIISTSSRSLKTLDKINIRNKTAIIIGNEGAGVSEAISLSADHEISIPLHNEVESLNASVSHGILSHQLNQLRKTLR